MRKFQFRREDLSARNSYELRWWLHDHHDVTVEPTLKQKGELVRIAFRRCRELAGVLGQVYQIRVKFLERGYKRSCIDVTREI